MVHRRTADIIDFKRLERESLHILAFGFLVAIVVNIAAWGWFAGSFGVSPEIIGVPPERIVRVNLRTLTPPPRVPMTVSPPVVNPESPAPTAMSRRIGALPDEKPSLRSAPDFEGPRDSYRIGDIDSLVQAVFDTDIPEELKLLLTYQPSVIERIFQDMSISRIPGPEGNRISLRDELLRVEDLDVGKYQALVVIDPDDAGNVTGFIHIPSLVWGESLVPPMEIRRSVTGLAEALKMDTGIITTVEQQVKLDSLTTKQYPFIIIAADESFDLTPSETAGVGEYLRSGGFIFAEAYGSSEQGIPPPSAASLRRMFHDALGRQIRPIENTHMIYHSLYDFDDGPPSLNDNQVSIIDGQPIYFLEGAWVGDRLVGVYSEKGYAARWAEVSEATAFTRFGVNIVVYAMMQRGGMTFRLVDDR